MNVASWTSERSWCLGVALVLAGCAPETTETAQQRDPCGLAPPSCVTSCHDGNPVEPTCEANGWSCGTGVNQAHCGTACDPEAAPTCADDCESMTAIDPTCEDTTWSCDPGVDITQCSSGTCDDEPMACLVTCDDDEEFVDALCDDEGTWSCPDGIDETTCDACGGEEPPECIEACGAGEVFEAECGPDGWTCGDGVLLSDCALACEDGEAGCQDSCDPWLCVSSCEAADLYDAACVEGEWSCEGGMLAADC